MTKQPVHFPRRKVFLTCWLVYTLFWTPFLIREHFPAVALIEHGSLNVEKYLDWCEDIFAGPHGGAWINNNPGASLAGAIPLLLFRPLLTSAGKVHPVAVVANPSWSDDRMFRHAVDAGRGLYFLLVAFLTTTAVMAPLSAGTAVLIGKRLAEAAVPVGVATAVSFLYALGTPVFFRTAYLNHNLLVGHAGLIAFLLLRTRPLRPAWCLLAGLLAGFAVLCDYSGVVLVGVLGLYVLVCAQGQRGPRIFYYAAGILPGVLALLIYQQAAFGNFWLPSQHYMAATAPTVRGYRGFDWPSTALIWANFFDARFGLFAYCPMLALAFAAPFVKNAPFRLPRWETAFIFLYFAGFVLFSAANHYSWLQPTTGFRYLAPVVPGLFILALQVMQKMPSWLQCGIAAFSVLETWALCSTREHHVMAAFQKAFSEGFPLPWIGRTMELGLLPAWSGWSYAFYGLLAIMAAFFWPGRGFARGPLPLVQTASGTRPQPSSE